MVSRIQLLSCVLFSTALFVQSSYSNHLHTAENRTDGDVTFVFRYAGLCKGDTVTVPRNSSRQIQAWGCCLNQPVEIFKKNGNIPKDQYGNIAKRSDGTLVNYTTFHPQTTGLSLSCTSNHIVVQDAGSFGIIATRPEDA